MQKQVNFFERHVQWFAVGLGALFLLFMVFQYVLSSPIKVAVGGQELAPGEVDDATLEGPIKTLKNEIAKPGVPEMVQVDYVTKFLAIIQGTAELPQLATTWTAARPMNGKIVPIGTEEAPPTGFAITELPKLPAAKPAKFENGRTTVMMPDPKWEPNPKKPDEQPEMVEADKDWWSGAFIINGEALAKAFQQAFNAAKLEKAGLTVENFTQTAFVDVELVRQQVLPGGKFGKEMVVKPLAISPRKEFPFPGEIADADKLPDAEKRKRDEQVLVYLNFVLENPQELRDPAFYEWKAGDQYVTPAEAPAAEVVIDKGAGRERRLALEKKNKQAMAERRQKAKEAARAQQRSRGSRGGGAGGGGGGGMPSAMPQGGMGGAPSGGSMPNAAGGMAGMRPGGGGPPGGGSMPSPYGGSMGGPGGAMGRPGAMGGGGGVTSGLNVGPGRFSLDDLDDIQIVAHDDTVQPGKSYRYMLRYRVLNPVYKSTRAAPAPLTKQFSIASPDGPWTKAVTIRPQVEFFLAGLKNDKAEFDVFEWRDGQTRKSKLNVGPGDAIGSTGWSVVDLRGSGSRAYGLLMDTSGAVERRDPEGKSPSERYQDLLAEVDNPEVGMAR